MKVTELPRNMLPTDPITHTKGDDDKMEYTADQINEVCQLQSITAYGYEPPEMNPTSGAEFHRQVGVVVEWLKDAPRDESARVYSYAAKHLCEELAGTYVSNGALLVAVNLLGIPHEAFSQSAWIGVSERWYRAEEVKQDEAEREAQEYLELSTDD